MNNLEIIRSLLWWLITYVCWRKRKTDPNVFHVNLMTECEDILKHRIFTENYKNTMARKKQQNNHRWASTSDIFGLGLVPRARTAAPKLGCTGCNTVWPCSLTVISVCGLQLSCLTNPGTSSCPEAWADIVRCLELRLCSDIGRLKHVLRMRNTALPLAGREPPGFINISRWAA